jgi:hypothetical protein
LRRGEGLRLRAVLSARVLQTGHREALLPERLHVSAAVLGHQASLLRSVLRAAHLLRSVLPGFDARMIYWAFFLVTPGLFVFVYASKRATDGLQALPSPKEWPWWELFACTLAYAVWGLAVPGNPYVDSALVGAVAAFGAVFISTLLTLAEPIVLRNRTQ